MANYSTVARLLPAINGMVVIQNDFPTRLHDYWVRKEGSIMKRQAVLRHKGVKQNAVRYFYSDLFNPTVRNILDWSELP